MGEAGREVGIDTGPGGRRLSILGRATKADIRLDPYPHVVVHDALPEDVYRQLDAEFPEFDWIAGSEARENNRACLKPAAQALGSSQVSRLWQAFFEYHLSAAFFDEFVALWGPTVLAQHPGFQANFGKALKDFEVGVRATGKSEASDNREADVVLDCVFGVNTPVWQPTPVRGPHIDSPFKLFSSLLYFRRVDDDSVGGDHQMFRLRRRMYPRARLKKIPGRYVEPVGRVPYRANTLLFWLNGVSAIHGVTARGVTSVPRRYVATMGECYGGTARDGFFAHHPQWESTLGRARSLLNR
ncbi:MAG: hypothetical protein RIC56_16625 [Pseudomonadales bacterium]